MPIQSCTSHKEATSGRIVEKYETSDLNLASFLRCRQFVIADMLSQGGKTAFVFEDSPRLRSAILDFANDGAVQVRTFCNTLRDLKSLARSTA